MFHGVRCLFTGMRLITRSGMRRYVAIPAVINIIVFAIVLWFGIHWFDQFLVRILPGWLAWAEFILWPLFALSYFLIVFYLFALLMNMVAAPFNGLLAEKVEMYLRGGKPSSSASDSTQLLKEIPRDIGNEITKLIYFLLRSIPLLLLFVIPGINVVAPFLWLLFTAWMLSLEYLDYPMSNHKIHFKTTRALVRQQRLTCLSFGAVVTGLTMIPVINFIAMPAAVAGATVLYYEKFANKAESFKDSQ